MKRLSVLLSWLDSMCLDMNPAVLLRNETQGRSTPPEVWKEIGLKPMLETEDAYPRSMTNTHHSCLIALNVQRDN